MSIFASRFVDGRLEVVTMSALLKMENNSLLSRRLLPAIMTSVRGIRHMITDGVTGMKRMEARSILCYWATEKPGITQSHLALVLKRS